MKIISVVGARPNFIKIAPFAHAIDAHNVSAPPGSERVEHILVHTGQHYDKRMSADFFDALGIRNPDMDLGVGSGTHAEQVGRTMIEFEKALLDVMPDWVVVVGDVNAACACSITAKKHGVRVAHIEAGLRSFDRTMPEEINRVVADHVADLLLASESSGMANLRNEGVGADMMRLAGNIMIDSLEAHRAYAGQLSSAGIIERNLTAQGRHAAAKVPDRGIALLTLHRPSNVDEPEIFTRLVEYITGELCAELPVVWPLHPRAETRIGKLGLWDRLSKTGNLFILQPVGYVEMIRLNMDAAVVLTDSGGLQEECCVLGTPCLTLRHNTERPATLAENGGTNILTGNDIDAIRLNAGRALAMRRKPYRPAFWDGRAAPRCLEAILGA